MIVPRIKHKHTTKEKVKRKGIENLIVISYHEHQRKIKGSVPDYVCNFVIQAWRSWYAVSLMGFTSSLTPPWDRINEPFSLRNLFLLFMLDLLHNHIPS
jgi:hypothetical protein